MDEFISKAMSGPEPLSLIEVDFEVLLASVICCEDLEVEVVEFTVLFARDRKVWYFSMTLRRNRACMAHPVLWVAHCCSNVVAVFVMASRD